MIVKRHDGEVMTRRAIPFLPGDFTGSNVTPGQ
jgi:hypothetical protein